jgi:hypothetical protein
MGRIARAAWMALIIAVGCTPTNPIYCTPDETMCHGSCAALYKDPINCGACDSACSSGLVCSEGTCANNCGGGTIQCGQSCVEILVDHDNCGACGVACGAEEACVEGSCSSNCRYGQALCLAATSAWCASVLSDNHNCGACGVVCDPATSCINGACTSACILGQTRCSPTIDLAYCTDLNSDPSNCGKCGTTCATNGVCAAGVCECPGQQITCGTSCIDTSSDDNNCGGCNIKCSGSCAGGRCAESIHTLMNPGGPLALTTAYVYWTDSVGALYRVTKKGTGAQQLSSSVGTTSLALDSTDAYWPGSGSVGFVPLTGGTLGSQSMPVGDDASEVVSDGTNVYVSHATGIVSFPSGGGSTTPVVTGEPTPHGLTVFSGALYWANDDDEVRTANTDGTGLTTLATMTSAIGAVTSDGVNVYFTLSGSEVLAVPVTGSSPAMLLASGLVGVGRIATYDKNVYYIDATSISTVPTGGGAVSMIASTSGDATDLAVDSSGVYWTSSTELMKVSPP